MSGVRRAINNFKLNYSQALSCAALAKGETTWQCPNHPGRYLYRSPDGSVGPLAEFKDQFKGSIYKFYEDDRKVSEYNRKIHELIKKGAKHGYMVSLSEEAARNVLGNRTGFTSERVDRIPVELLKTGLESGALVINDQENHAVDVPAAPGCKSDAEYIYFDKQRQMAATAEFLCGKSHKFAKNPVSKNINNKNHERLRRDVDFIENGMNPDIVRFNEKFGTSIDTHLHNYEKLKDSHIPVNGQRPVSEDFTKEDEAFALFKAIEHFSAPGREELREYLDEMRQSALMDKKQETKRKNLPADRSVEIQQEEKTSGKENQDQNKKGGQGEAAPWDDLIQKVCQFFIDYARDPAETLNRFMAEYSGALQDIRHNEASPYHKEFQELLNSSEKPVVKHISDELESEKPSKEYTALDKYLRAKNNHIEIYRSFLSDGDNADIKFVNTEGKELDIKSAADMDSVEMEALADLIDSGKISMSVDGEILDRLTNDTYMGIRRNQDMIYDFEKQDLQLRKEQLNAICSLNDGQKREYAEKNGLDLDVMRKAYQYSFNKVNAMEHGRDMTDAAMEQLGIPYNKEETILDKRINAYLAAQSLHHEHYNHEFEKAAASGEPVTVYNYKNKIMNPVRVLELDKLSPADKTALSDLIDHERVFMYAGDKRIEPVLDRYTNPDNYKKGGEFYSPELSETEFKSLAEMCSVKGIDDKIKSLDNIPSNNALRKELESEKTYRKSISDYLNGEDAKSTDTCLVSAKHLGLIQKINNMGNLREYYKRDGEDIQKMVSEQTKKAIDKNNQQSEAGHKHLWSDDALAPGHFRNEALRILSEGQINGGVSYAEECPPCFH